MDPRWRSLVAFAIDLAVVGLFVLIGRASHREDQSAFLTTFWPFLVGSVVGWAAGRVWRTPFAILRAGAPVWIATVIVGMLLRAASGQGLAVSFVIVASIVMAVLVLGWRVLVAALDRSVSRDRNTPGPVGFFLRRH